MESLLTAEQRSLREEVRAFVRDEVPRQLLLDMDAGLVSFPRQFLEAAAKHRLLGLRFPKEYGGRGLKWVDEIIAIEEIGVLSTSLPCLYSLVSIIGEAVNTFGTPAQKEQWLRPVLEGRMAVAEALTEPRGGSDFFGAATTAHRDGDSWTLNGQKRFIVGAEGADYFLVYARTQENAPPHESISSFIVERSPEIEVQHVYGLMGMRGGGTGRVYFRNARVPAANIVGPEHGGALVFNQIMIPERMTSAAGAIGGGRAAIEIAARYADQRKAFGQKIRRFEGVSFKIADSLTKLDAARSLTYAAAHAIDAGDDPGRVRRLVSEAKKFGTETGWAVVNDAMQVMGGIGYTNVYPIERILRDSRLLMIWTGTNEIMNLLIQHEYYKELGRPSPVRNVEADAPGWELPEEKVYE
ncbi:MAG: acyl-CoA dehydrogenase family protein [Dehalococcoidia bacterium]|jgi:alkylation response protein AidB-like acyl-CoA dehydrogenase